MCVCVYAHECRYLKRPDEGVRLPGAGVPGHWVVDMELGSSEKEQGGLLIAELFLQPLPLHLVKFNLNQIVRSRHYNGNFTKGERPCGSEDTAPRPKQHTTSGWHTLDSYSGLYLNPSFLHCSVDRPSPGDRMIFSHTRDLQLSHLEAPGRSPTSVREERR